MSEPTSYQANPMTRSTTPAQFFQDDNRSPITGTKATPRPPDRPRELPETEPESSSSWQEFSEGTQHAAGAGPNRRPDGLETPSE